MTKGMDRQISVSEFERNAIATDQLEPRLETALLGLVREVGSLVSALKKKRRDTDGFLGYHDAVLEELGDVLWYVSAVDRRGGTALEDVLSRAIGDAAAEGTLTLGALAPRGSRGMFFPIDKMSAEVFSFRTIAEDMVQHMIRNPGD
jgi:NTP pyrophosphatase (non-canonical NTP hydrolase)